ncbi:unnamed protein product [Clonostachys byssicola]|uniref:Uncharacterized protein n=1 Tax=Clonostachys byssicola TaxID=160290 RepID=A0A9N9UGY2_9HYPO|nr:unnamed protein product [Clonostachys byssicola]
MSDSKKPEEVELSIMKPPPKDSPTSPVDSEDEDSAEQPAAKAQDFVLPRFDFERPQRFMDPERYLIEIIQHVKDDDDEMVEDETGEVDDKSASSEKSPDEDSSDENPSDEKPSEEKLSEEKPSEEKPLGKKTSSEEASDD